MLEVVRTGRQFAGEGPRPWQPRTVGPLCLHLQAVSYSGVPGPLWVSPTLIFSMQNAPHVHLTLEFSGPIPSTPKAAWLFHSSEVKTEENQ